VSVAYRLAMPLIEFDAVLKCLEVEEVGAGLYTAPNIDMPYYRIFGGQLLAQAIAIATTCCEDKSVKSIQVNFPRAGDLRKPVEYKVEKLQEGRSFAALWMLGSQEGKAIVAAQISMHVSEEGLSHQMDMPTVEPAEEATPVDLSMIPWETRAVAGVDLESREIGPAEYSLWMRTPSLPEATHVHQALLAHGSDLTLIGTALRPHSNLSESDSPERIQTAVTTHSIWFHRALRMDDWILLSQQSPVVAGARAFGSGHAFNAAGELVASFAQEGLVRLL
jgi:acyl-CoA thioesterase-2